jgi:uncharacterized membrane protein YebE (DUF533 family)
MLAMASQQLSVIKVWAAVAWADGSLGEAEARGLSAVIRTSELSDNERATAMQFLDHKVELPDAYLAGMTLDVRRGVYRAACRMAIVDHVFAATERSLLDRLRGRLGLTVELAAEIEAEVPGVSV